jgi:hypothetical protein
MLEAGELLGMSERQFRRYRERYEEDGVAGLSDGRLGKPSPKRVPAADVGLMLELYRDAPCSPPRQSILRCKSISSGPSATDGLQDG